MDRGSRERGRPAARCLMMVMVMGDGAKFNYPDNTSKFSSFGVGVGVMGVWASGRLGDWAVPRVRFHPDTPQLKIAQSKYLNISLGAAG
eukprot:SAG31_NODE_8054_length_1532_cov_1.113747_2_plen_88_part_01